MDLVPHFSATLISVEHENEIVEPSELSEGRRMSREFVCTGIASDPNGIARKTKILERKGVEDSFQDRFSRPILAEHLEHIHGSSIERVLDGIVVRSNRRDPSGTVPVEEYPAVGGNGVEDDRTMGRYDELQILSHCQLL